MLNLLVINFLKIKKQESLAVPNFGIFMQKKCTYVYIYMSTNTDISVCVYTSYIYEVYTYTSDALGVRCVRKPNELSLLGREIIKNSL